MKREYVRPTMVGETFTANEYVAACGDSGVTYKFECTAAGGPLYYYPDAPINPGDSFYTNGNASLLGFFYSPCGKSTDDSHDASNNFYAGFVDRNYNGRMDNNEKVIVWRGPNNDNGHATTNLNTKTWETAKS